MADIDTDFDTQDELDALKSRADLLGIKYHPSIGVEKLREKVNAAIAGDEPQQQAKPLSKNDELAALQAEASKLIRIRVTCMNPAKKEWEGEIFTVSNSVLGTYKKFVPFNVDDGWHVPNIIYQMMKERDCQIFYNDKDSRGNTTRKGKMIKEFAIEVLPPLTPEELKALAASQAARNATAE